MVNIKSMSPPLIRAFVDKPLINYLKLLVKNLKVDLIHTNVLNPNSAWNLSILLQDLRMPAVFTVHT